MTHRATRFSFVVAALMVVAARPAAAQERRMASFADVLEGERAFAVRVDGIPGAAGVRERIVQKMKERGIRVVPTEEATSTLVVDGDSTSDEWGGIGIYIYIVEVRFSRLLKLENGNGWYWARYPIDREYGALGGFVVSQHTTAAEEMVDTFFQRWDEANR